MQCQLFSTGKSHCDFILWTKNEVYVERVYPDESFWKNCIKKVKHFFETAIMPELTGRYFSRPCPINQCTSAMATAAVTPPSSRTSDHSEGSENAMEIEELLLLPRA